VSCCHVAGEFRVFDRHAAQQVINSTAEAAFVVGKFAISDSQSTPAFSDNRAATAFAILPSRTVIAAKQAVNYSRRAAETREKAATKTGNIIIDLAIF
jgi:exopolysaccharide biosynthesis protein